MTRVFAAAIFFALTLVNCGKIESVREEAGDALPTKTNRKKAEPTVEACRQGENRPAADGCNTCSCNESGWSCTEMACLPKSEKPEGRDCLEELPPELEARIQAAYAENQKARDQAIDAERTRLAVTPLMPTNLLGNMYDGSKNQFKPETDPFPESVVALGAAHDIRAEGYELNHGKMGMTRVYETAPGSKKYFIVDRIGGDGVGGNGKAVVEETFAAPMLLQEPSDELEGNSWHSWHVSADNKLVRANQVPTDELQNESRICGCGALGYEDDPMPGEGVSADWAPPVYPVAIFMLPADVLPEVMSSDEFQAKFVRQYFKKIYVPRPGKVCRKHEVVC
jgi:hypothetical protein